MKKQKHIHSTQPACQRAAKCHHPAGQSRGLQTRRTSRSTTSQECLRSEFVHEFSLKMFKSCGGLQMRSYLFPPARQPGCDWAVFQDSNFNGSGSNTTFHPFRMPGARTDLAWAFRPLFGGPWTSKTKKPIKNDGFLKINETQKLAKKCGFFKINETRKLQKTMFLAILQNSENWRSII